MALDDDEDDATATTDSEEEDCESAGGPPAGRWHIPLPWWRQQTQEGADPHRGARGPPRTWASTWLDFEVGVRVARVRWRFLDEVDVAVRYAACMGGIGAFLLYTPEAVLFEHFPRYFLLGITASIIFTLPYAGAALSHALSWSLGALWGVLFATLTILVLGTSQERYEAWRPAACGGGAPTLVEGWVGAPHAGALVALVFAVNFVLVYVALAPKWAKGALTIYNVCVLVWFTQMRDPALRPYGPLDFLELARSSIIGCFLAYAALLVPLPRWDSPPRGAPLPRRALPAALQWLREASHALQAELLSLHCDYERAHQVALYEEDLIERHYNALVRAQDHLHTARLLLAQGGRWELLPWPRWPWRVRYHTLWALAEDMQVLTYQFEALRVLLRDHIVSTRQFHARYPLPAPLDEDESSKVELLCSLERFIEACGLCLYALTDFSSTGAQHRRALHQQRAGFVHMLNEYLPPPSQVQTEDGHWPPEYTFHNSYLWMLYNMSSTLVRMDHTLSSHTVSGDGTMGGDDDDNGSDGIMGGDNHGRSGMGGMGGMGGDSEGTRVSPDPDPNGKDHGHHGGYGGYGGYEGRGALAPRRWLAWGGEVALVWWRESIYPTLVRVLWRRNLSPYAWLFQRHGAVSGALRLSSAALLGSLFVAIDHLRDNLPNAFAVTVTAVVIMERDHSHSHYTNVLPRLAGAALAIGGAFFIVVLWPEGSQLGTLLFLVGYAFVARLIGGNRKYAYMAFTFMIVLLTVLFQVSPRPVRADVSSSSSGRATANVMGVIVACLCSALWPVRSRVLIRHHMARTLHEQFIPFLCATLASARPQQTLAAASHAAIVRMEESVRAHQLHIQDAANEPLLWSDPFHEKAFLRVVRCEQRLLVHTVACDKMRHELREQAARCASPFLWQFLQADYPHADFLTHRLVQRLNQVVRALETSRVVPSDGHSLLEDLEARTAHVRRMLPPELPPEAHLALVAFLRACRRVVDDIVRLRNAVDGLAETFLHHRDSGCFVGCRPYLHPPPRHLPSRWREYRSPVPIIETV